MELDRATVVCAVVRSAHTMQSWALLPLRWCMVMTSCVGVEHRRPVQQLLFLAAILVQQSTAPCPCPSSRPCLHPGSARCMAEGTIDHPYMGSIPACEHGTARCQLVCTTPAVTTGYVQITEANLDLNAAAFVVYANCATGWDGTAQATACSSTNPQYTLSGCTQRVCTTPTDVLGYEIISEGNLDLSGGNPFDVVVGCSSNYEGTALATACSALATAVLLLAGDACALTLTASI